MRRIFLYARAVRASGILVLIALVAGTGEAYAQTATWIAGAAQYGLQRFSAAEVPNRLDGSASGWTTLGGLRLRRHVALRAEWSDAGEIADADQFTLDVNGRAVKIESTFAHRTRSLAALGGFAHDVGSRTELAYLAGVALASVRRTFTSNAPALILVPPSNTTMADDATSTNRSAGVIAGADALFRLTRHAHLVVGVRAQSVTVAHDQTGWSIRSFGGLAWVF